MGVRFFDIVLNWTDGRRILAMTWPYMKLDFHDPEYMVDFVPHGEYIQQRLTYYSELVLQNGEFDRYRAGGLPCSYTRDNRTGGLGLPELKIFLISVLVNPCVSAVPI